MAATVDEEGGGKDGGDILSACELRDKLINVPQIERASAGRGRQLLFATLSIPKDQRKLAVYTLGQARVPARWPLADPEGVVPTRS